MQYINRFSRIQIISWRIFRTQSITAFSIIRTFFCLLLLTEITRFEYIIFKTCLSKVSNNVWLVQTIMKSASQFFNLHFKKVLLLPITRTRALISIFQPPSSNLLEIKSLLTCSGTSSDSKVYVKNTHAIKPTFCVCF